MVISFLDGSAVLDAGMEVTVKRRLRRLIRDEQEVTFYFYVTSDFLLICEWVARELQAAYPKKKIERVGVVGNAERDLSVPWARYMRLEILTGEDAKNAASVWKWMVDQADYVICHMDLLLCSSRDRAVTYQYAQARKGGRCINLCSDWEVEQVRERMETLARWEREALVGKMRGDRKAVTADRLGVSKATVRTYEISAQHNLVRQTHIPNAGRQCAIFGLSAQSMPLERVRILQETLHYLVFNCGVSSFIISSRAPTILVHVMHEFKRYSLKPVNIERMQKAATGTAKGFVARLLEERNAMTDIADIILCDIEQVYRSGLNYARKKQVPTINLANQRSP